MFQPLPILETSSMINHIFQLTLIFFFLQYKTSQEFILLQMRMHFYHLHALPSLPFFFFHLGILPDYLKAWCSGGGRAVWKRSLPGTKGCSGGNWCWGQGLHQYDVLSTAFICQEFLVVLVLPDCCSYRSELAEGGERQALT